MSENQTAQKALHHEGSSDHEVHPHGIKETASQLHSTNKEVQLQKADQHIRREKLIEKIRSTPSSYSSPSSPQSPAQDPNVSVISSSASHSGGSDSPLPLSSSPTAPACVTQPPVAQPTNTSTNSGTSDVNMTNVSLGNIEDVPTGRLRRHHKANRVVAIFNGSADDLLAQLGLKSDTVYGVKSIVDLGALVLFFKNKKLASSALTAASKTKIPLFAQTIKTEYRYSILNDLNKQSLALMNSKLGTAIINLNISNKGDDQFWCIGTNKKIKKADRGTFRLNQLRTDLTTFRFAFNAKEKEISKLIGAVSRQWKVKIDSKECKVVNKVAYIGIPKDQINTNVTQFIKFGNAQIKNLSFSANVAKSIAIRLENVEKQLDNVSKTVEKLSKSVVAASNKKLHDSISSINDRLNKLTGRLDSLTSKLDSFSKSTAHHNAHAQGNGRKGRGRKSL